MGTSRKKENTFLKIPVTMQIVPDERLFLETDDSLLDIEDILCQAARVRGVEVEALCEVIRRNIQNVFFKA